MRTNCLVLIAVLMASPAAAQNYVYSSPGTYTLPSNSVSSGMHNISITSSNVTLNLNGRTVRCAPAAPSSDVTFGISMQQVSNVIITNGTISGCMFGVFAGYTANVTLEDIDFTGNTYIGAHLAWGSDHIVRRCTFAGIGGYRVEAYAIGINGVGHDALIEDNRFENMYRQAGAAGTGEGLGILIEQGAQRVTVRGNTFVNATLAEHTLGVWLATGSQATVSQNTFTDVAAGIASMGALTVRNNSFTLTAPLASSLAIGSSAGVASNNTISGYAQALDGGISDGGGNVVNQTPTPPPPPPPDPPPSSGEKFFRICVDNVCYEGNLRRVGG